MTYFWPTAITKLSAPTMKINPMPRMVDVDMHHNIIGTKANLEATRIVVNSSKSLKHIEKL